MATYNEAPPLLRRTSPESPTLPPPPPPPPSDLTAHTLPSPLPQTSPTDDLADVSWQRPADTTPPSASVPSLSTDLTPPPDEAVDNASPIAKPPSFLAKLLARAKAIFSRKSDDKPKPVVEAATVAPATKPALVRAKELVCKLPDPTLLFVLEASAILLLHAARPAWLQTWAMRIAAPLLLVPTVAATALWRRTSVISLKEVPEYFSAAKPIPNAGLVVSLGEGLRAREAAVVKAEAELRKGQMRLEVLRKEIEGRLPPTVSIAHLLDLENEASRANAGS